MVFEPGNAFSFRNRLIWHRFSSSVMFLQWQHPRSPASCDTTRTQVTDPKSLWKKKDHEILIIKPTRCTNF